MKYLVYIALLFFSNQETSDIEKMKIFSNNLVNIISEEKICELISLNVFPEQNTFGVRGIDYILGNDHQRGFVELFKNKDLVTKIYGPYLEEEESYYFLIYYDPDKIKRNEKGKLDAEIVRESWGKDYVETLVTVIDDEVYFYRTPFFFETELLW